MLTTLLVCAASVGLLALMVQRVCVAIALRRPVPTTTNTPGISILKPLCGLDDALEENLEAFASLDYPNFEVLLGLKDRDDAAWPVAQRWAAKDRRFRVVQQRTTPGLNPKVNQLVTLANEAEHELLMVSDSNARLPSSALRELAARFENEDVGCVTNPVSGLLHQSFGSLLDNLHLASGIGAAQLGAKTLADRDLVVGKSMTLRRVALEQLGGFEHFVDVLAEDYVIGQDLRANGWRVEVAQTPVWNVSVSRSTKSFFERYLRWGVIHRTAVSLPTSLAQGLVNPLPWLVLALLLSPSFELASMLLGAVVLKVALDASSAHALKCGPLGWRVVLAVVVKDALLFITWLNGFFSRTVLWRGRRLRVGARSRLVGARPDLTPAEST
ncbi:MAG: glycosyltransferase [Archangium sp.]